MTNKLTTTLLIICIILLAVLYFTKPSGHTQALERQEQLYKDSLDIMLKTYNKIITEKDHQMYLQFKKDEERYQRKESELVITQRQLKHEKALNRRFSDHATDSLLSRIGQ